MILQELIEKKQKEDADRIEFHANCIRLGEKLNTFFDPAKGVLNEIYFQIPGYKFKLIMPFNTNETIWASNLKIKFDYEGSESEYFDLSVCGFGKVIKDLLEKDFNTLNFSLEEEN